MLTPDMGRCLSLLVVVGLFVGAGAAGDECGPDRLEEPALLSQCLERVSYSARQMAPVEALPGTGDLRVFLDANFRAGDATFQACCDTQHVQRSHIRLNPLDDTAIQLESHLVRNEPVFNFYTASTDDLGTSRGNYFFLLLLDFSSTEPELGSVLQPFCHLAIANMNGLEAPVGDTLVSYLSPTKKDRSYMYFLYKQKEKIEVDLDMFTVSSSKCTGVLANRCMWDIPQLLSNFDLEVVGVTWHYVVPSTWSYFHTIHTLGQSEANVCMGIGSSIIRTGGDLRPDWVECAEDRCRVEYLRTSGLNLTLCLDDIKIYLLGDWYTVFSGGSVSLFVFMDVVFRSPEWTVSVCCEQDMYKATMRRVNPARREAVPSHMTVNQPQVEFYVNEGSPMVKGDTEYSMLVLVDLTSAKSIGAGVVKHTVYWLLTNINGLEISSAKEIVPYYRPVVDGHDYVLLLFKQPVRIDLDISQYGPTDCFAGTVLCAMDIDSMVPNIGLQLVGASRFFAGSSLFRAWYEINHLGLPAVDVCRGRPGVTISGGSVMCPQDLCLPSKLSDAAGFDTCADAIHKGVLAVSPEIISYSDTLDVYVDVAFRTTERDIRMCCEWTSIPGGTYHLNPLSGIRPDVFKLTGQNVDFKFSIRPGLSLIDPSSVTYFLLLMIDISGGTTFFRSDLPFLHMAVVDIPDLQWDQGTTVINLLKPAVPNDHVVLLYKQEGKFLPGVAVTSYRQASVNCPAFGEGRCMFNVRRLVRENNLSLVGSTWVTPLVSRYGWMYNDLYNRRESPKDTCPKYDPEVVAVGDDIVCPVNSKCSPSNLPNSQNLPSCLRSLKDRAYQNTDLLQAVDDLLVYISIKYTWSSSTVRECCRDSSWVSGSLVLDPLADQHVHNYQLQQEPEITLLLPPGSAEGSEGDYFFCLVSASRGPSLVAESGYIGAGRYFMHWAVANIRDLDVTSGDVLFSYVSPADDHMHAFLVFRQHDVIHLDELEVYSQINGLRASCYPDAPGRCHFHLAQLRADHKLHLVAMSWVTPREDTVYSASVHIGLGMKARDICTSVNPMVSLSPSGALRCPSARCDIDVMKEVPSTVPLCLQSVSQAATLVTLPRGLPENVDFRVFMYMMFRTEAESMGACNRVECIPESTFNLNPLDESRPRNYKLRNKPSITFLANPNSGIIVGDDSMMFTILLVDLGGLSVLPGEEVLYPYVHWLKTNIHGLEMKNGNELLPYWGPDQTHNYVFYLFKQKDQTQFDLETYSTMSTWCGEKWPTRCGFKLAAFINDLDLQLVGGSWVQPAWSPYTSWRVTQLGLPCPAVHDWKPDCPSPDPGFGATNPNQGKSSEALIHTSSVTTLLTFMIMSLLAISLHQ